MTVKEVSLHLGIPIYTVYYQAEVGKLPGHKVGGQWRFNKLKIDLWNKKRVPSLPAKEAPIMVNISWRGPPGNRKRGTP